MIHELTVAQIAELSFAPDYPLVICDVDEVIVHFTREFEEFLTERDMELDFDTVVHSFAMTRYVQSRKPVGPEITGKLIDQFFAERTLGMKTIDGAVDALKTISLHADIVLLTNLPHQAGDHRRQNLVTHGLNYPVVTNSGPKGPAIRSIAERVKAPVIFIDDSPGFITSAYEHAPHVHLVHFVQDKRFLRISKPLDFVSLATNNWADVQAHVLDILTKT
jgi:hypothetical protein